jgi:hypothetical protein
MDQEKKFIELPKNWWRRKNVSFLLSDHLLPGFIQLILKINLEGQVFRRSCTGFLIELDNQMLWVSAAHVIDAINKFTENDCLINAIWIDRFNNPNAPVLPFSRKKFTVYSGEREGFDFGALLLPVLEVSHFRQNRNIKPFVVKGTTEGSTITHEGYIFVGFPWETNTISESLASKSQVKVQLKTQLKTLPLRRIEHPKFETNELHWDDPDAFYGEVLPYLGEGSVDIDNFKGMSGGPILSFKQDEKGIYLILEGIFSSFIQSKKYIRAEPQERVIRKLKEWLSQINVE